jgi:hypothetical protein
LHLLVLVEEEHLRRIYGEQYVELCRKVPRYAGWGGRSTRRIPRRRCAPPLMLSVSRQEECDARPRPTGASPEQVRVRAFVDRSRGCHSRRGPAVLRWRLRRARVDRVTQSA